jgi:hypothetical protein
MEHTLLNKDKKSLCLTEIYNLLSIITQWDEFYQIAENVPLLTM